MRAVVRRQSAINSRPTASIRRDIIGFIEVHIEQGPAMWEQNIPVAIVTAVNGRRQYSCQIRGVANHAGSTPMNYRYDALAAAAECIGALKSCRRSFRRKPC